MSDNDNSDGDGDDDDDDNFICGSNARSYRSVCHLLQDTGFTSQVRHSGRCDANMCRGGMVSSWYYVYEVALIFWIFEVSRFQTKLPYLTVRVSRFVSQ